MRRIRGEDVDLGLKEWIKEELKSGPGKEYDLGKFFFTVSSGTIGFLLAAEKLTGGATWDCYLILSFATLIGSIILALVMVLPKKWSIDDNTDPFDKRDSLVVRTIKETYGWFVLWLIGVLAGTVAVFT